ncbi:MAG TPA: hypothetical protein VET26_00445 [Candidatus Sulfotelmatobacter sp.]|nr:hypothetical protein [Candidatus Sulfotelmatobacter sp.]
MTPLSRLRYVRIAGLALGAVAVAGAAVLITASASGLTLGFKPAGSSQSATATDTSAAIEAATAGAVCTALISHFSSDLHQSQATVNAAIQKAIGETLADEVKNKQLTQAQADAIKKKLAAQPLCTLANGLGKRVPSAAGGAQIGAYTQQVLAAAAAALGITPAQLRTDLAGGQSLSQIAAAQNPPVTEAQFRTKLIAQITPLLDAAVKSSKLTAAQEHTILQRLQTGPIPFWNTSLKRPKPAAPATPTTTTI